MKYRGVEYYVAQGVEAGTWKFSTSMNDKIRTVRARSRKDAAKVVEQRIEEALTPKKRRLVKPRD
jgi:predicted Holliday junction resolvase-like endonuclease